MEFICPSCGEPAAATLVEKRGFFQTVRFTCACGESGIDDVAVPFNGPVISLGESPVVGALPQFAPLPVVSAPPAAEPAPKKAARGERSTRPAREPQRRAKQQPRARKVKKAKTPGDYRAACREYELACKAHQAVRADGDREARAAARAKVLAAWQKREALKPMEKSA